MSVRGLFVDFSMGLACNLCPEQGCLGLFYYYDIFVYPLFLNSANLIFDSQIYPKSDWQVVILTFFLPGLFYFVCVEDCSLF